MSKIGLDLNKIYNCDFKEKINEIKNESIDMVLTDIPYMIGKKSNIESINDFNTKSGKSTYQDVRKCEWDRDFDVETYLDHCCRILKPSCSLIVFGAWQQLYEVDCIIKKNLGREKGEPRVGIWKKTNPQPTNMDKMALQPYEFFLWNRKGKNWVFNNLNGFHIDKKNEIRSIPEIHFFEISSPRNSSETDKHQAEKPRQLFEWLILTYTNKENNEKEPSIIFDGCMGGGTTAVAALKNKRNFIGFEMEEEYCKYALKRLKQIDSEKDYIVW